MESPKEVRVDGEEETTTVVTVPAVTVVPAAICTTNNNNGGGNSDESSTSQISPNVVDVPAPTEPSREVVAESPPAKQWTRLNFQGVDPKSFVGLECKVFWPEDIEWYYGEVVKYNPRTNKHQVNYDDGDVEMLTLSEERIRFLVVPRELKELKPEM